MAFPSDLSDVVVFKIHPAIGIARLSVNDDYFVFGSDPGSYKSNGMMKRQAVQFRIFAYGDNHVGLGELTSDVMNALNITPVWSAKVANRKIARQASPRTPLGGTEFVIAAEASSDVKSGRLVGSLPSFAEGAQIPLGQILPNGVFVPPKAGVFRKTAGEDVPSYPGSDTVSDNTCDGSVAVGLLQNGQALTKDVLPACIIVCAHDFSPDVDPPQTVDTSLLLFFKDRLQISPTAPPGNLHNQTARNLDEAALGPATSDFAPGVEVSLGEHTEVVGVRSICYQSDQDPRIDPREIRVRYRSAPNEQGAVPGQLTSGLCSPWQADYTACVGYWADHVPRDAFLNENSSTSVQVFRKISSDTSPNADWLSTGNDMVQVDQVGVVRMRNSKLTETERGGDIAAQVAQAAPLPRRRTT